MTARVQNKGLDRITTALFALSWYLQWGTSSGAAASANVVTTTGTTEARVAGTATQQTSSVANDQLRITGTITAAAARGGGGVGSSISEIGVFDAAGSSSPPTGGNMDIYGDFTAIPLYAGDSITFTINTTFS